MRGNERRQGLWVLRAQCGDREALESLLRSVQPTLRRYLARLVGPPDVDDVLQDTLLLIARRLSSLHEPERFQSWAFRIANREGIHHLKQRKRWSDHLEPDLTIDDLPATDVHIGEGRIVALLAEHEISAASRAVLALHFDEQLPLAEVATVLEIPLGTAKSRLAYGLAVLRKRLGKRRR